MRQIKFKAKRTDTKEWVYGSLCISATTAPCVIWCGEQGDSSVVIDEPIIDPDTIGQFTGLTDKNGTEIYEGDILNCPDMPYLPLEVYYNPKKGAFCLAEHTHTMGVQYGTASIGEMLSHYPNMHVVGNIHDNPDLLTDKLIKQ